MTTTQHGPPTTIILPDIHWGKLKTCWHMYRIVRKLYDHGNHLWRIEVDASIEWDKVADMWRNQK